MDGWDEMVEAREKRRESLLKITVHCRLRPSVDEEQSEEGAVETSELGRRFTTPFDPADVELEKREALRGIDADFIATSPSAMLLRRRAGKKQG